MGQRRKHVLQNAFTQEVQAPADNQHIVKALGSRGGNIVEVEYPNGTSTLCMMPAKFNRKLWVKRGGFVMIESSPEAEQDASSRVTGTICAVLYEDHIKQLKKQPGVWPPEFASSSNNMQAAAGAGDAIDLHNADTGSSGEDGGSSGSEDDGEAGAPCSNQESQQAAVAAAAAAVTEGLSLSASHQVAAAAEAGDSEDDAPGPHHSVEQQQQQQQGQQQQQQQQQQEEQHDETDSDDGLPPLQQIQNRRVVHHYTSDSESEDSDS